MGRDTRIKCKKIYLTYIGCYYTYFRNVYVVVLFSLGNILKHLINIVDIPSNYENFMYFLPRNGRTVDIPKTRESHVFPTSQHRGNYQQSRDKNYPGNSVAITHSFKNGVTELLLLLMRLI